VIAWESARHTLGLAEMDEVHQEFVGLLAAAIGADDASLAAACDRLIEHVHGHFANETRLMRGHRFAATAEHEAEHARILGDLGRMRRSLEKGRLAIVRNYLAVGMPEWFANHLLTMDAALAAQVRAGQRAA
jgi:hemerythrin